MVNLRLWWAKWGKVVMRLSSFAAAIAALLGLSVPHVPTIDHLPWWGVVLAAVSAIAFIVAVVLEIKSVGSHRVFELNDSEGIRDYMHNWIGPGGRVAIWTRDMSWAQNETTIALLEEKAAADELIICLPEPIPLTDRLKRSGAEICPYGRDSAAPASRFTITFFDRDGARVAVGRAVREHHVVDEFDSGVDPVFYIAHDLVRIARKVAHDRA